MPVKSTYNFVPAPTESEVFTPEWADQVSHDIPFSDGESGEIEFKITAKTPIFIRNGHTKEDAESKNEKYLSFSHRVKSDGSKEYFIPATSLKGMVRNVLEIMSFSRMKQIGDDRYSFRDLTRNSLYMNSYSSNNVKCGWLYEDSEGNWLIDDCGKPVRIGHDKLDDILGTSFRTEFLNNNPKDKSAVYKYKKVKENGKSLVHRFSLYEGNNKTTAQLDPDGQEGEIVLTGQSSRRSERPNERPSGKLYEFVFLTPQEEQQPIKIKDSDKKDFKFIYLDHDKNNISNHWKFWKGKLESGGRIPVFFTRSGTIIKHFGLAFMYKLPYNKSIHQSLPYSEYAKDKMDLAELIFGSTQKESGILKGRVFMSNAPAHNAVPFKIVVEEILAGPKASYFPFYLKQDNLQHGYTTYMDKNPELRGYKRYPIHTHTKSGNYDAKQLANKKVFSAFRPLEAGAVFSCKIRFHNLKKVEIGALISALTFHGNEDVCFHSLGAAKSFGYGKVQLAITSNKFLKEPLENYQIAFEEMMGKDKWLNAQPIKELLTMAVGKIDDLRYPKIEDFVEYKKPQRQKLDDYTTIAGQTFIPKSMLTPEYLAEQERQEAETIEKSQQLVQQANTAIDNQNFEQAEVLFKNANKLLADGKIAERLKRIATKKLEFEVTDAFATAKETHTIESYKKFLREYPNSAYHEECSQLKKELEAESTMDEDLSFSAYSYSTVKKEVKSKLKNKLSKLSDKQVKQLLHALTESYVLESENLKNSLFHKKKKSKPFNAYPWKEISAWVGEENAQVLFTKLTAE